ncbi:MAG TPA: type II toxin-antitoxin system VapC family toxin [Mycobacteriales bacterium]|nr:type II toxin-antitoxin system VapC family toxin [Mycobacteriales bacterium]
MILVDTSVWIDHLHKAEPALVDLLARDEVVCHSLVIEELALGSIKDRELLLESLVQLRGCPFLTQDEMLALVGAHRLWGRGLSAVDCHLLGSLLLVPGTRLWTRDKRLRTITGELGVPTAAWS